MLSVSNIKQNLRTEMEVLSLIELKIFAHDMGVDTLGLDRKCIEDECVNTEVYCFTH